MPLVSFRKEGEEKVGFPVGFEPWSLGLVSARATTFACNVVLTSPRSEILSTSSSQWTASKKLVLMVTQRFQESLSYLSKRVIIAFQMFCPNF